MKIRAYLKIILPLVLLLIFSGYLFHQSKPTIKKYWHRMFRPIERKFFIGTASNTKGFTTSSEEAQLHYKKGMDYLKAAWLREEPNMEEKAMEEFKKSSSLDPVYIKPYMHLAMIYAYKEKFKEAFQIEQKIKAINDEYWRVDGFHSVKSVQESFHKDRDDERKYFKTFDKGEWVHIGDG